jgi:thymidylate synthase (FAD)
LFKHKQGFVENEVSRRYVVEEPEVYLPRWRTAPTDGAKQGSSGQMEINDDYNTCNRAYMLVIEEAMHTYNMLLERGVAPEQARFVLPQGTYTEWWWTGSLAAYARVCKLRSDSHAQWEVREYSNGIGMIIRNLFPVSWAALITK